MLNPSFNSTAPVQSQLMRNLSLCLVAQKKWVLEGLDLTTAFLQTGKTEESREIWTYGVPELKSALGAEDHEVLRILKNIYGNATAPRGIWEDIDRTLKSMGGIRLLGDSSFWVWSARTPILATRLTPSRRLASWEVMWTTSTEPATWTALNGWRSGRRSIKLTLGEP